MLMVTTNEAAIKQSSNSAAFLQGLANSNPKRFNDALDNFFQSNLLSNTEFQEYFSGRNRKQFVAAARVSVEKTNNEFSLSMPSNSKLLFWTNSNWGDFQSDCDAECKQSLEALTTIGTSSPITRATTIHTELKMLYGNIGRSKRADGASRKRLEHHTDVYPKRAMQPAEM